MRTIYAGLGDGLSPFAAGYFEARRAFRDAAGEASSYPSSAAGPNGDALSTDVAWLGRRDAGKVAVTISAVHGVEGYCGSACQIDWMAGHGPRDLGPDEAVLLVHALNPYGFAWDRRVTEEGCDLNRNFVDFTQPLPDNAGYDELASYLVPSALDGPAVDAAEEAIRAFRQRHGELAFQVARKSGQYRHPQGLSFGGFGPTAARRTLERIVADFGVAGRERVNILDYHTGLGPFGYGELQCEQPSGLDGYRRARAMFGQSVTSPDLGTSSSVLLHGTLDEYWQRLLGPRHVYVALEFGTFDAERARRVLRQDHWLHAQADIDPGSSLARRIRLDTRRHWYPDTDDWREMVLWRGRQVMRQAIEGLSSDWTADGAEKGFTEAR